MPTLADLDLAEVAQSSPPLPSPQSTRVNPQIENLID